MKGTHLTLHLLLQVVDYKCEQCSKIGIIVVFKCMAYIYILKYQIIPSVKHIYMLGKLCVFSFITVTD